MLGSHFLATVILAAALATNSGLSSGAVAASHPRLTMLGDSITYGVGASDRSRTSYAMLLAKDLGATLTDLGIPGETEIPEPNAYFTGRTVDGIRYAPRLGVLAEEVPRIPPETTIATLWIGTNDLWLASRSVKPDYSNLETIFPEIASDYGRYIAATISAIHARAPLARILVATNINPADKGDLVRALTGPAFRYRQAMTDLVNRMNAVIEAQGVTVIDLHCDAELYDIGNYLTPYDLHPNDHGHARIAEDFYAAIKNGGTAKPCIYSTVLAPLGSPPVAKPN